MGRHAHLGEFELMVMLSVLQLGPEAYATDIMNHLERQAGRRTSRGALYSSLERLEKKAFLQWTVESGGEPRSGYPKRRFQVTRSGVRALRDSRRALTNLWAGLDGTLEESPQ